MAHCSSASSVTPQDVLEGFGVVPCMPPQAHIFPLGGLRLLRSVSDAVIRPAPADAMKEMAVATVHFIGGAYAGRK